MRRFSKQMGISLVEILVALVISLFLLAGIIQVYVGNKTTFAFTNALAEIQENGRFALDTMSQDLRLVNQWGCISFDPDDTDNINNALTAPYNTVLHDFVGDLPNGGRIVDGTNNTGLNGSDTLILRGGKPGQTNVEAPFTDATDQRLFTDTINTIGPGDIILVARCGENDLLIEAEADILSVTSVVPGTTSDQRLINLDTNKSQQFQNDAMVIELQAVTYSIATGASGRPALFRQEFNAAAQELIDGVQDMQILYGIDSDNDQFPNQYVTSNNVPDPDFEDVVSIRIMLLLQSIDDFVTEAPQTYSYNGATITPVDRRLRQVFTTTIALRNRIGSS